MKFSLLFYLLILFLTISGCKNDPEILTVPDDGTQITISLQNLPAIGDSVEYIAWLYFPEIGGTTDKPVKIGVIDNVISQTASKTFTPFLHNIRRANSVVISIQSMNDTVPGPTRILSGNIQANSGSLTISDVLSVGAALDSTVGNYTLFTPTDTTNTQQNSGIWFVNYNNGNLLPGFINLPELSSGWKYEGRIEINGTILTTGRFTLPDETDEQSPYSGTHLQIDFPGEDFLNNPPNGVTFPLNLAGAKVHVVIVPSNNVSAQGITIMTADIPVDAAPFTTYSMNLNTVFPIGNFSIDVNL